MLAVDIVQGHSAEKGRAEIQLAKHFRGTKPTLLYCCINDSRVSSVLLVRAVKEQASAVLNRFDDWLIELFRNCGATMTASNIALLLNYFFTHIRRAVHYNGTVVSIIVKTLVLTEEPH